MFDVQDWVSRFLSGYLTTPRVADSKITQLLYLKIMKFAF